MPQPYKGMWTYDVFALRNRPALAARVGNIAHFWTLIDVLHGELLAKLLRGDAQFATAVYLRLRGARTHALSAVAEEVLQDDWLAEFRKVMKKCREVEGTRNDVIHALWGTTDKDDKDIIIRIDPATHVRWHAAKAARKAGRRNKSMEIWASNWTYTHFSSAVSYNELDFATIERQITDLFSLVYDFSNRVDSQLRKRPRANKTQKKKPLNHLEKFAPGK
jgi:hypothetical protein